MIEFDGNGGDEARRHRGRIDDKIIAGGATRKDSMTLTGTDAARIIAAMIQGKKMTLTDIAGAERTPRHFADRILGSPALHRCRARPRR